MSELILHFPDEKRDLVLEHLKQLEFVKIDESNATQTWQVEESMARFEKIKEGKMSTRSWEEVKKDNKKD